MVEFRHDHGPHRDELDAALLAWGSDRPARPGFGDELRRRLERRFARRRRRALRTAGIVAGIVVFLSVTNLVEVGSDSFDLMATDEIIGDSRMMVSPFNGDRVAVFNDGRPQEELLDEAEYVHQLMEAGGGTLVRVVGWQIGDEVRFSGAIDVVYKGEIKHRGMRVGTQPSAAFMKKFWALLDDNRLEWLEEAHERGELSPLGQETRHLYGHEIRFTTWSTDIPGHGTVIYWDGVPVD